MLAGRARPYAALRVQLALIALTGLVSIVLRVALAGSLTGPMSNRGLTLMVALPGFLDWFAIGMGLAVLAAAREAGRAPVRPLVALSERPWWCAALALLAFGVGIPAQHGDMFLPWYGLVTHLALGAGSGFVVLALTGPDRRTRPAAWVRLLRSSWLTWMGTISYGVYLWHLVVIELISRRQEPRTLSGAILLWLATLAGALVLGAASWYGVERPLQRALRARERRPDEARGRTPDVDAGVHSVA